MPMRRALKLAQYQISITPGVSRGLISPSLCYGWWGRAITQAREASPSRTWPAQVAPLFLGGALFFCRAKSAFPSPEVLPLGRALSLFPPMESALPYGEVLFPAEHLLEEGCDAEHFPSSAMQRISLFPRVLFPLQSTLGKREDAISSPPEERAGGCDFLSIGCDFLSIGCDLLPCRGKSRGVRFPVHRVLPGPFSLALQRRGAMQSTLLSRT